MSENMKNSIILIGNSIFPFTDDPTSPSSSFNNKSANTKVDQNFGRFSYFTQDTSNNLTVFLNRSDVQQDTTNNNEENFPFFYSNQMTVDFPFITPQQINSSSLTDEDVKYLGRSTNPDCDPPEYIDINSLALPSNCFPGDQQATTSTIIQQFACTSNNNNNNNNNNNSDGESLLIEDSDNDKDNDDDDDVVFVEEYRKQVDPLQNQSGSSSKKKILLEPRRNPRRQVQLQKVAYDVATRLSWEGCYESTKFGTKDSSPPMTVNIGRRSRGSQGAVHSPPNHLKNSDFKEWPVDGMHEKPAYNPATKKIEKHPSSSTSSTAKRGKSVKIAVSAVKRAPAANKRKRPVPSKKASKCYESKKGFATMAHHNLHFTMAYVNSVKKFNEIMGKDADGDNLKGAGDILENACVLYCLANDVGESSLAKYLNAVTIQDDVTEFVDCVVDGCTTNV